MSTQRLFQVICSAIVFAGGAYSTAASVDAVSWRNNLDAAKIEASQSGKLLLLHFYTSTCGPCRMLDENVFSQAHIGDEIERNYVPVKINAEEAPALAGAFNIERVPSEIVLTPQGNVVASLSCPQSPTEYTAQLTNLAEHVRNQNTNRPTNQAPVQAAYAGLQVGQPAQQQTAPAQPQGPVTTAAPAMTNNPYATAQQPTNYAPAGSPAYANPQVAVNYPAPTMPANAMPNSYRQQSAAPSVQPQQPLVAANPIVQQQIVANAPTQQVITNPAAAQINTVSHMSVARQLPEGSPPLAFDGYCPVALKTAHKWVAGDLKFGAIHRGRTFLFMGEDQRQQFLANPDAFCPVFSGMDPVILLDSNQVVEGTRRYGFEYRGAFYLFANQESMDRFKSQPDQYAAGVRQAMSRLETASNTSAVLR